MLNEEKAMTNLVAMIREFDGHTALNKDLLEEAVTDHLYIAMLFAEHITFLRERIEDLERQNER